MSLFLAGCAGAIFGVIGAWLGDKVLNRFDPWDKS